MDNPSAKLHTLLRKQGYSVTAQRLLVFEATAGREPMTMHDLCQRLAGQLDRASIYRTVTLFEKLGVVQRIAIGWKYKIELSDMFTGHHHHLTCLGCHRIIPINEEKLEDFIADVATNYHFTPSDHQVEIQGHCAACTLAA